MRAKIREEAQECEVRKRIIETVSKIKSIKILKLIEGFALSGYMEEKEVSADE